MAPSWDLVGSASLIARQSIGNDISNVKNTFSSWDSCMSKTYCKWPVIAAIIVGSLIVASILFCIVRCCCCGMECCCGICGCCNSCCSGGRRNNKQYQPAPQQPMYPPPGWGPPPSGPVPWQPQPQPQNTMMYGGAAGMPGPQSVVPSVATYESAPKQEKSGAGAVTSPLRGAEDQLPAMPSWAAAREHHVQDTSYHPAEDKDALKAQEAAPLQDSRRPSPSPGAAVYTDNIPLQDRQSPPARAQTASPGQSTAYGRDSDYAASTFGQEPSHAGPMTAYGAGAAALGASQARYPQEKAALNTNMTNPNAFARLPHATSPISPVTPVASSIYSSNPPPSYTTNAYAAAPSTRTTTPRPTYTSPPPEQSPYQAPVAAPARTQSPYSAYNPYPGQSASPPPAVPTPAPAYQAYNPFGGTSAPHAQAATAELGGQPRSEMGAWGEGPQRRPAPGWREV